MASQFYTDINNNPTAFITEIAKQARLIEGKDYVQGTSIGGVLFIAKLLGDPIELTIKVIDTLGFYTKLGAQRWVYIGIPDFVWFGLSWYRKKKVIGWMYEREGGIAMKGLFNVRRIPN